MMAETDKQVRLGMFALKMLSEACEKLMSQVTIEHYNEACDLANEILVADYKTENDREVLLSTCVFLVGVIAGEIVRDYEAPKQEQSH